MTTQPSFVPNEAAELTIGEDAACRVRLVDCVGYMVPGAVGHEEDNMPRMVRTPWSEEEMPFDKAAEIGTRKVITDHSTIGIVMTTDGNKAWVETTEDCRRTNGGNLHSQTWRLLLPLRFGRFLL